jgi:hypothetical protein
MTTMKTMAAATVVAMAVCAASCSSKSTPPVSAVPAAPPDLSGVWAVTQPVTALRTTDGKEPPFTAEARKTYQERVAATAKGDRSWDDTTHCKPPGEPRSLFESGWPFQIGQTAERVMFMFQWNRDIRAVEMGLKLPDFAGPFFYGKSSGKWDGDTLVVDVIGVRDEVSLDSTGLPHSEDMKLNERFRLINEGKQLEARLRFDDPATFSTPWETVLVFNRQPDTAIVEDNCLDRLKLPNSYRPKL